MMEVDLHGLTVQEGLATLVQKYNSLVGSPHCELVVVHGYGSGGSDGILKRKVRAFLKSVGVKFFTEKDGVRCNLGQTLVVVGSEKISVAQGLEQKILDFCENPKTKEKIFSKFHKSGVEVVQTAFSSLVKSGLLAEKQKGKFRVWERFLLDKK